MADFDIAFKKFYGMEHGKDNEVLHHNKKERGLTFYGIYESAHPKWSGWKHIYKALEKVGLDTNEPRLAKKAKLERASLLLIGNPLLIEEVKKFYKNKFWNPLRLDLIKSQKIAEEMFFFYVNSGKKKKTTMMAQLIVGATPDGFIGVETISKLNKFDADKFDRLYDLKEIEYHARLVQANPAKYLLNLVGWIRRDVKV